MINNQINILKKKIPILQWSQEYNVDKALADLVAGITVGLTLIPQSLAYAALAGLEPQVSGYFSHKSGYCLFVYSQKLFIG